jgi:hypothetical protein
MSKFQVFGEDALFTNVRGKPIEADTIQAAVEVEKVDLLSRGGPKTEVEITPGEATELAPQGYIQLQVKGTQYRERIVPDNGQSFGPFPSNRTGMRGVISDTLGAALKTPQKSRKVLKFGDRKKTECEICGKKTNCYWCNCESCREEAAADLSFNINELAIYAFGRWLCKDCRKIGGQEVD